MFMSRLSVVKSLVFSIVEGGWLDFFYRFVLMVMLFCFLSLRVPYIFGVLGFSVYLFFIIFPIFLSLFLCRVVDGGVSSFFSTLVPDGTPISIAPFVCLAETLSYIVRPMVLMLRPSVIYTIGSMEGYVLGLYVLSSWLIIVFLFNLLLYEVLVALVHSFIVCSILSFSENH
uniref:ATP synthase F0 subunit 6 n=1 Tax=Notocotylus intestinalis TaxID=1197314 RepID=A0A8A4JCH5_9TREM|nr:ATP synthase F0 subunit 6 [Notocotylus intestinalis]QTC30699.1 ATP synthase F0 subunit 6 [Notocotylus intestinalis]